MHDPYEIEEDEPLAYTFPESEFDDDSDGSDIDGIFIDSDDEFVANNINQSASPNHQATGDNAKIVYTDKSITHNTNLTYISKNRLRTWRYHANFGAYTVLEADDQKLEKAKTMQKHWSEYLDHLSSGCQTDKKADELQEGLLEDPAYRRLFLKDAVLFLEDIDAKERQSQLKVYIYYFIRMINLKTRKHTSQTIKYFKDLDSHQQVQQYNTLNMCLSARLRNKFETGS